MVKRWSPGCNCCTCLVFSDDFNRADNDDPGGNWNEVSGDWDIVSNVLEGITDGILVTTQLPHAPHRNNYAHSFFFTIDSVGGTYSEWHVIVNYVDSNNFDWIKIAYDTDGYYPTFYTRSGGTDTAFLSKSTHPKGSGWTLESGKLALQVCMADVEYLIQPTGAQAFNTWQTCERSPVSSLPSGGEGLVGFKKGAFDDASQYIHWEAQTNCNVCNCFCQRTDEDYSCLPEELTLTLDSTAGAYSWGFGSCSTPTQLSVTLYQQSPDTTGATPTFGASYKTPKKFVWLSDLLAGDPNSTGPTTIHGAKNWFALVCDEDKDRIYLAIFEYNNQDLNSPVTPSALAAQFQSPDGTITQGNARFYEVADSTCDPLSLVFIDIEFPRTAVGQCDVYGTLYDATITA